MADWTPPTQDRLEGYFKELNNWGRWGHDDQLGTVNLITPAKQAQAQRLVKKGRTVSLARDVVPRPVYMYHMTFPSKRERVDVVLDRFDMVYHGYWITHVDALCHVGWDGELYNGRPFAESLTVEGALWCPIDPIFTRGITSRGVFLDVAAGRKEGYVTVGHPVTPRELDEDEIYERLKRLTDQLEAPERAIFNIHVPPWESSLDTAFEVDEELRYVTKGGRPHEVPCGSQAVRQVIEEVQPLLSLHGHIHESKGVTRIGRTVAINPGSDYGSGHLDGCLVHIAPERVVNHYLVSG